MQKRKIYRLACLLVLLTVASIGAFSQQAATASTTGQLIEIKVPAPSLKGNLLGDPVEAGLRHVADDVGPRHFVVVLQLHIEAVAPACAGS